MPDLLSHVLFAYGVVTLLRLKLTWVDDCYITVGMLGALIPDISKAYLVIDEDTLESFIGMSFEWYGLHTIGGVLVLVALVAIWFEYDELPRVLAVCSLGGMTHLLLDSLIREPMGYSYAALWPLTYHRVPSPGIYISTDMWPLAAALVFAAVITLLSWR